MATDSPSPAAMTMTLWHICPNGIRTSWVEDFSDVMVACPLCGATFVYVEEFGWSELAATP